MSKVTNCNSPADERSKIFVAKKLSAPPPETNDFDDAFLAQKLLVQFSHFVPLQDFRTRNLVN